MNKQQAIDAMRLGKKVTHRHFLEDEFVYIKKEKGQDCIFSEDGVNHGWIEFWELRTAPDWQIDWSIVD